MRDIVTSVHRAKALVSRREHIPDLLKAHRVVYIYATSPFFRRFVRKTLTAPRNLLDYFGYGLYMGRK